MSDTHNRPIIREATVNDAEPVRRMQAQSWLDTYPSEEHGISREWVEGMTRSWFEPREEKMAESRAIFQYILDNPSTQFYRLAEVNGRIIGFVHGEILDEVTGKATAIYIDKQFHGTGLAQQFNVSRDNFFRERGIQKITTTIASHNARSLRFHEKLGYHKTAGSGRIEFGIIPVVDMERKLSGEEEL